MNEISNLDQILYRLRKKSGLTQKEVAEGVNLSRGTIIAIEKGRRRVKVEELLKICRILDCSYEDILFPNQQTNNQGLDVASLYDLFRRHNQPKSKPIARKNNPIDAYLKEVNPYYYSSHDNLNSTLFNY